MTHSAPTSRLLIYVLPFIHACACLAIEALHSGWQPIALADYPISTPVVALAFHFNQTAFLFFLVMGTLWWFGISRAAVFCLDRIMIRRNTAA